MNEGKKFTVCVTLAVVLVIAPSLSYANLFSRVIGGLLGTAERSAATNVGKAAVAAARRTAGAVAAGATAYRASRAATLLKEITISTIGSVAATEVIAAVEQSQPNSPLRFTAAYYAILAQRDPDAAMGMWLSPEPKHFQHLRHAESYWVENVKEIQNDGQKAVVQVTTVGKVRGEDAMRYHLYIHWQSTQNGWRVSRQQTISI